LLCTDDGVYASGCNSHGQLGVGDNIDRNTFTKISLDVRGFRDGTGRRSTWEWSPSNQQHDTGGASATNNNSHSHVPNCNNASLLFHSGNGNTSPSSDHHYPPYVVCVASGSSFCALITETPPFASPFPLTGSAERQLYVWGNNECGQLGLNDHEARAKPTRVPLPFATATSSSRHTASGALLSVACGAFFSMLVTTGGHLYACGANGAGQLGLADRQYRSTFTHVSALEGVLGVVCGASHVMALTREHGVYAWGRNSYGQLV
jgi:hypothetical protein